MFNDGLTSGVAQFQQLGQTVADSAGRELASVGLRTEFLGYG